MQNPLTIRALATLCFVAGFAGFAQADVYASPPLYGGLPGGDFTGQVTCRIFNAGSSKVDITNRRIFSNVNVAVTLTQDTCNVALGPNKFCAFAYSNTDNLAFSCKAVTSQTGTNLRGVAEYRGSDGSISNSLRMTK